jgi:hypothetical protein
VAPWSPLVHFGELLVPLLCLFVLFSPLRRRSVRIVGLPLSLGFPRLNASLVGKAPFVFCAPCLFVILALRLGALTRRFLAPHACEHAPVGVLILRLRVSLRASAHALTLYIRRPWIVPLGLSARDGRLQIRVRPPPLPLLLKVLAQSSL